MIRFIDGFDHYLTADLGQKWDTVLGGTVGAVGRFGSQGLGITDGQKVAKVLPPSQTLIVGFAFRLNSTPGADRVVCAFLDGNSPQLCLCVSASGVLYVSKAVPAINGAATPLTGGTAGSALSVGSYHYIEFKAGIGTSIASGDVAVRVAGVPVITIPAATNCQSTGNAYSTALQLGQGATGIFSAVYDVDFDDLYVLDSTGAVNNTYIGDMRVEVLYPTGDGSHTDFTIAGSAPAATKWQSVNEASEDGDVTFLQSATAGAIETFTFGALATTPTSIAAVQVNTLCRKDDAGTRIAAAVVTASGTDHVGGSFGVGDSYALARSIFELNPDTSAAWTPTAVNALEAGIKLVQ